MSQGGGVSGKRWWEGVSFPPLGQEEPGNEVGAMIFKIQLYDNVHHGTQPENMILVVVNAHASDRLKLGWSGYRNGQGSTPVRRSCVGQFQL
jgi:hypothetical protein